MNFLAVCSSEDRSISSCSTPQSSGNSASNTLPPSATSRSAQYPTAGLAEIPLKPSLPPHLTPSVSLSNDAGVLCCLLASVSPSKVFLIASLISCSSLCDCCCSKMNRGLSKEGCSFLRSSKKSFTCKFWQPRLNTVTPATLG